MEPTATLDREVAHHAALDARLVEAVGGIRLLGLTSWPATVQVPFLDSVARGQPVLPKVDYPRLDFSEERRALAAIAADCDDSHPLGHYVQQSAQSWDPRSCWKGWALPPSIPVRCSCSARPSSRCRAMARVRATRRATSSRLPPNWTTNCWHRKSRYRSRPSPCNCSCRTTLDAFFESRIIQVQLDPELVSKAAAGPTRIRLRTSARFSAYDRAQLFHHEALVHSLTALNGREQPVLPSLALSSPRVTATQEGLATFAEQITGSIDIERLKRISLRTEAIAMAREGADFIEVFRYFCDAGQNAEESFASAQRVFRGVPPSGGLAFTKDTVYLRGLVSVHTFFRHMLAEDRLQVCRWLFAGKMSLTDAIAFAPLFEAGY